ncbi:MAG: hypothetical protein J6M60_01990 [Clostridia bacterium]|nr:hypothetical protein [Clostridia bacterium]
MTQTKWNKLFLGILLAIPVVICILVGCGPSLFPWLGRVFKALFANVYVVLAYIYIAVLAFVLGRNKGRKETESNTEE